MTLFIAAISLAFEPAVAGEPSHDACTTPQFKVATRGYLSRTVARLKAGKPLRILAIGSSSTQGVGASSADATYPMQLERALARKFPGQSIKVINSGIAGETSKVTLARLDRELNRLKPDLVLWQVGTNDALNAEVSETDFTAAVERGVAAIESRGSEIILIDQQFFRKAPDPARYERFVAVLGRVAHRRRLHLFSRYLLMKFWEASGHGGVETMLAPDGFHMNDRGYACFALLLADHIQKISSASPQ